MYACLRFESVLRPKTRESLCLVLNKSLDFLSHNRCPGFRFLENQCARCFRSRPTGVAPPLRKFPSQSSYYRRSTSVGQASLHFETSIPYIRSPRTRSSAGTRSWRRISNPVRPTQDDYHWIRLIEATSYSPQSKPKGRQAV